MKKFAIELIYIGFFLSGMAGLIYEVVWAKYLGLLLGHTAYAYSLVLALFMGGIAFGSLIFGRLADKVKNNLLIYALIQLSICLYCLFTPNLFEASRIFSVDIVRYFTDSPQAILAVKFLLGALIIFIPTILMGGTFPILSRLLTSSLRERGHTIARLYYVNSFGAVVGTILAGFVLIFHLGLAASTTVAAIINCFVAISMYFISKIPGLFTQEQSQEPEATSEVAASLPQTSASRTIMRISLIGIFISGFTAMLYEVVWIRLLYTTLGSSVYSFSLMLAAFICGISIGSFILYRIMPSEKHTFLAFGLCQIGIGILVMMTMPFYERLPFIFSQIALLLSRTESAFHLYMATKFILAFMVMLPPAIFLGMALPLVSRLASSKMKELGKKIGVVFAVDTFGNISGALVTGLVLIAAIGLQRTLELGVFINLALGLIVVFTCVSIALKRKLMIAGLCVVVTLGYVLLAPQWSRQAFTAQIFRGGNVRSSYRDFKEAMQSKEILFYEDGVDATVAITRQGKTITLFVNGKADASSTGDLPTQILSGHIPMMLKPDAKEVLVIGLGSGITAGSTLLHPVERLDLVEISSSVVRAAEHFAPYNYNVLENPRMKTYIEDAKTFLMRFDRKYDVIISEPSNPWMSGSDNLFSKEFFAQAKSRLKDQGIMVQWLQAYEIDDLSFRLVLRTFGSIFKHTQIWYTGIADMLIIGSDHPFDVDFQRIGQAFSCPDVMQDLERIKILDLFTLLNLQLSSDGHLHNILDTDGPVNSDYFPKLGYLAPKALFTRVRPQATLNMIDQRSLPLKRSKLILRDYLSETSLQESHYQNAFDFFSDHRFLGSKILTSLAQTWIESYPLSPNAIYALSLHNTASLDKAILLLNSLIFDKQEIQHLARYAELLYNKSELLSFYLTENVAFETIERFKEYLEIFPEQSELFYFFKAKVYSNLHDHEKAISGLLSADEFIKSLPEQREPLISPIALARAMAQEYLQLTQKKQVFGNCALEMLESYKDDPVVKRILDSIGR